MVHYPMFRPGASGEESPVNSSPKRRAPKTADGLNKVSCSACRAAKCKCVESDDQITGRCQRCTRLDIECLYQAHQRGRKRKDGSAPRQSSSSTTPSTFAHQVAPLQPPKRARVVDYHESPTETSSSESHLYTGSGSRNVAPLQPLMPRISSVRHLSSIDGPVYSSNPPSPTLQAEQEPDSRGQRSISEERRGQDLDQPANSVYHEVANRSIFSIAGVMDRRRNGNGTGNGHTARDSEPDLRSSIDTIGDDPVGLGLLTMDECDSLFGHYFDQLQTCVCLLDPAVHTATYARRVSLPLFSAVLCVSCKFFRPELYETVLTLANELVSRAIADCVCAIEVVQAILILHYWKKPTDGRGWLRLGHAIRLGYQLDLHLPRRGDMPTDERAARLTIDRERTWISLFCFDSTMTQLSDRPSMMHKAPDVETWIRDIPYPLPSDGQLDFAVKTSLLSAEVRQLQSCQGSYEVLRSGLRRVLEDLHRSHQGLGAESYPVRLTSTSVSINKFSTLATQLLVDCTSLSFAPRKHRIGLLHACVTTSLDLIDVVVEGFVRKGVMPMIEDAHSVAVASTALRLMRFMSYLDMAAKSSVMRKLTKVVIVCREAARGDQESHPAYLARFIHALLDKAHQSRAPSRASSPARQNLAMTPMLNNPGGPAAGPGVSPHTKTTPDQWWDEIGQFAYQEPPQPFNEHRDFWDGFPLLAGAMNTLSPVVPSRVSGEADGLNPVDTEAFTGLNWDAVWDLGFLGISQGPVMG